MGVFRTTYLLRNGLNSVHMSLTKLKDSDYKSAKVCIMSFKCSGCVFVQLGIFLLCYHSESIRNGSKVRPVQLPFIPLATLRYQCVAHRTK